MRMLGLGKVHFELPDEENMGASERISRLMRVFQGFHGLRAAQDEGNVKLPHFKQMGKGD